MKTETLVPEQDFLNSPLPTTQEVEDSYLGIDHYLADAVSVTMDDPSFTERLEQHDHHVVKASAYMALAWRSITLADRLNPGGRFKILMAQLRDPNLVDIVGAVWPLIEAFSAAPSHEDGADTED